MSWLIITVAVVLVVGIALALSLPRPKPLNAAQFANYLREFIEGSGRPYDWDDFEYARVDPKLQRLHQEAITAGPPDANLEKLKSLLAEAEALSGSR